MHTRFCFQGCGHKHREIIVSPNKKWQTRFWLLIFCGVISQGCSGYHTTDDQIAAIKADQIYLLNTENHNRRKLVIPYSLLDISLLHDLEWARLDRDKGFLELEVSTADAEYFRSRITGILHFQNLQKGIVRCEIRVWDGETLRIQGYPKWNDTLFVRYHLDPPCVAYYGNSCGISGDLVLVKDTDISNGVPLLPAERWPVSASFREPKGFKWNYKSDFLDMSGMAHF